MSTLTNNSTMGWGAMICKAVVTPLLTCNTSLTLSSLFHVKSLIRRYYVWNNRDYKLPHPPKLPRRFSITNYNSTYHMSQQQNYYMLLMGLGVTAVHSDEWQACVIQPVHLLVSASPNQPTNSVFLSQQTSTS